MNIKKISIKKKTALHATNIANYQSITHNFRSCIKPAQAFFANRQERDYLVHVME